MVRVSRGQNPLVVPGSITLLADCDFDSRTGSDGFDVALEFSSGLSISTLDDGASSRVETGVTDLELTKAPSHSAHDAEIGFPRGRSVGAQKNLFSGREGRWKLVVRDESGQVVQQGQHDVPRVPSPRLSPTDNQSREHHSPQHVKIALWRIGKSVESSYP